MINLNDVISKYPECLESSEKLRAYLTDLYPNEKAKIRIIIDILNCGIVHEMRNGANSDEMSITRFSNRLENEYGYSPKLSRECLGMWLAACDENFENSNDDSLQPYEIYNFFKSALIEEGIDFVFDPNGGFLQVPRVDIDSKMEAIILIIGAVPNGCIVYGGYGYTVSDDDKDDLATLLMLINSEFSCPQFVLDYNTNQIKCQYRYQMTRDIMTIERAKGIFYDMVQHLEDCGDAILSVMLGAQTPEDAATELLHLNG